MMTSITSLLCQTPIFTELDAASLQTLASHCRRRQFKTGEALFHEGDIGNTLYIVMSGRVNIQSLTASGETVHIAQRIPGEHFGELALLTQKPRMADAVTAEPTELLMLDHSEFLACVARFPQIALRIIASLADRLEEAAMHQKQQKELNVLGRVCAALLKLAEIHNEEAAAPGSRIILSVTRQELAEQIGTTRFSVTRALTSLKETGALAGDGRKLVIVNVKKLQRHSRF